MGQSGPWSNGNKAVLCIPQTPALLEPYFFSVIFGTFVGGVYLSAEMQSVYSTAPVDWAKFTVGIKLQNVI